jgi:hypothetical protein
VFCILGFVPCSVGLLKDKQRAKMSKIGFAIIFFFIIGKTYSQQSYLVLIDADNDQVFRVRIGDTTYNSSELGHLSIPYLKDSTYNLEIGFPKKVYRDRIFSIRINKKDQGFQLKNLGEKGWALYNWQTRELKMPLVDSNLNQGIPERGVKRDDGFSRLMSAVVNDTSVMYNAFMPQKISKDTLKNEVKEKGKIDSSLVTDEKEKNNLAVVPATVVQNSKKEESLKNKIKYPYIKKLSERSTKTAKRITYIDAVQQGSADTITLFIPIENDAVILSGDSAKKIAPGKNKKKSQKEIKKTDSLVDKSALILKNTSVNTDCRNTAGDSDVDSLRTNILTENTIETKIAAANKYFKTKCFSTKQVMVLAGLFASDKSKYSFFQTAYPFISDKANVGQFVTLLSDTVYINRFKKQMTVDR